MNDCFFDRWELQSLQSCYLSKITISDEFQLFDSYNASELTISGEKCQEVSENET